MPTATIEQGDATGVIWKQHPVHAKSILNILTAEECNEVKSLALAAGMSRSRVVKSKGPRPSRRRTSHQASLPRTPSTEWLYERMTAVTEKVNADYWRFALTGIETIQVLRYRPMQYFRWHLDTGPGSSRKVTCIVNLSPPETYWRGGLQVQASHLDRADAPLQGAGTWFPSYLVHRATAPWFGERWVLVAWLTGPDWV